MSLELDGEDFPTDSFSELDGITFPKQFHVIKTVKKPRNHLMALPFPSNFMF